MAYTVKGMIETLIRKKVTLEERVYGLKHIIASCHVKVSAMRRERI